MKFSKTDTAVLFLLGGTITLTYLSIKVGDNKAFAGLLFGSMGCGIMLYAAHRLRKK
ncbi:MAG TPA: hypothetical protein VHO66_00870 [Ruminiclostridium sp.]|nr:hypothetical protein [Ruminiclostridium sp.]